MQPLVDEEDDQMTMANGAVEKAIRECQGKSPREFADLNTPMQREKFPVT